MMEGTGEDSLTFEEALKRLEQAVERLESGELTLEQALEAYEEGVRMARICAQRLQAAEARLLVLSQQQGRDVAVPLEDEEEKR
ncbi:MAG: exodeoxyribonuclease VII small subunit [Limnochordaceae bacterium]|nr:exodeoxyribonuclease VII small subunit [Limnochordaceae bacterium]